MGQIKANDRFRTLKIGEHHVGTPGDPLLGGPQGLKGPRGLPRFPGLGSPPRDKGQQRGFPSHALESEKQFTLG